MIDWYGEHPSPEGEFKNGVMIWQNVPQQVLDLLPGDAELDAVMKLSGIALYDRETMRLLCGVSRAIYLDFRICRGCGCHEEQCGARAAKCCPDCSHRSPSATLDAVERAHILETLRLHDGNKSTAAQALGIDRRTLYRKLKVYHG